MPHGKSPFKGRRSRMLEGGFTLVDTLMGLGLFALLAVVLCGFMLFSSFSMAALYNYIDLDDGNRIAIDQLTRDVRQANGVSSWTDTKLVLKDDDSQLLTYEFHPNSGELTRVKGTNRRVLLRGCDWLKFVVRPRPPQNGTYELYPPAATPELGKTVEVSWLCARKIQGRKQNTESVQTARIVIRKA